MGSCVMCQQPAHCGRATLAPNLLGITNAMHGCCCVSCGVQRASLDEFERQHYVSTKPARTLVVAVASADPADAAVKVTFYGRTRADVLAQARDFCAEHDLVDAICAQVHAWRAGIGSAHDAMTAISKLLHEQTPGGEGQS